MTQTTAETKTVSVNQPSEVDEHLARIDRAMPAPRKAPTLIMGIPID